MSDKIPNCIGAGTYYRLDHSESATGLSADASVASPSVENDNISPGEIRFDPVSGEQYCLPAIVSDLSNPDWYIRIRAAWQLGRTGDIEAILPRVEALHDQHKVVRDLAQEALHAMDESMGEPLPVRVLLCETVNDRERTDILLALTSGRAMQWAVFGYGSIEMYCKHWLEEDTADLSDDEKMVLAMLKRAAAAVLSEISRRSDANILLRAGDANNAPHQQQLLRGSEPRTGEVENLLLPASKDT
jgi:HEAT repeat protein